MTVFPVALVREDGSFTTHDTAAPFSGPDGIQHPADAWRFWAAEDWAAMCPGWALLPVVDMPPDDTGKRVERLPATEWTVTDDAVTVAYRVTDKSPDELAADVLAAQADAVARVNREAGEARARFITVTIGQEGTYLDKGNEADAFLVDEAPTPAKYPYLYAEAEATGQSVQDVAVLVQLTAQAWRPINARIEGLRQGALKAVKDAGTTADVAAVFPINWPIPG